MSDNREITLIEGAIQSFDRVAAGLALLERNYKGVLYEVDTTMGMAHAKAARKAIRDPRYEVEQIRKAAKAPIIALGKQLDAKALSITNALMDLELPIDAQIKQEEERKEEEKRRIAIAEAKRVADIQARIDGMRSTVAEMAGFPSHLIDDTISELTSVEIDGSFAEFRQNAEDVKIASLARLLTMRDSALNLEREKERIRLDREELAKRRAEDDARAAQHSAERKALDEDFAAMVQLQSENNAAASPKFQSEVAQQQTQAAPMLSSDDSNIIARSALQYSGSRDEIVRIVADYYETSPDLALELLRRIDWATA